MEAGGGLSDLSARLRRRQRRRGRRLRRGAGSVGLHRGLAVDAVWLNPFFSSVSVDGGYDVDDYRAAGPTIGTLEQFEAIVDAVHGRGIKVIADTVSNHSSNRHHWFQEALAAGPHSIERDRYVFREDRRDLRAHDCPRRCPRGVVLDMTTLHTVFFFRRRRRRCRPRRSIPLTNPEEFSGRRPIRIQQAFGVQLVAACPDCSALHERPVPRPGHFGQLAAARRR